MVASSRLKSLLIRNLTHSRSTAEGFRDPREGAAGSNGKQVLSVFVPMEQGHGSWYCEA